MVLFGPGRGSVGTRKGPIMRSRGICALSVLSALVIALGLAGCSQPPSSVFRRGEFLSIRDAVDPAVPRLSSASSLPVDASGMGTIQGIPTGAASVDRVSGTFELVLDPAPVGLPPRTMVDVAVDQSTASYRDGQAIGNTLESMNHQSDYKADPTSAATVRVRFRIDNGVALAQRLDLTNVYPADIAP